MEKATRKRHNEQEPEPSKLRKTSKKQLGIFLRSYFKRSEDIHWPIFRAVRRIMDRPSSRVLYPGSYCHVTASAVFSDVVYVDFDSKFKLFFEDPEVLNWIRTNKDYTEETQIKFLCQNFEIDLEDETDASFDLVISMSSGIVSKPCAKYLKGGGYFLVSDAHFDARTLSLDPNFSLLAVWNASIKDFEASADCLEGHFVCCVTGEHISAEQVQESIDKPKAKRSFKLQKEGLFYLFQKNLQ